MKWQLAIVSLLFVTCFTLQAKENDELTATVKLAVDSLETVNESTVQKPPCDIPPNPPVPLAEEFSRKGVGGLCEKFLTDTGEVGEWGQLILKTIDSIPPEELKDSFLSNNIPDMGFVCPRFSEFSDELKKKFWVWSFASIAWEEASCKPREAAQGVNCKAVGLLQLEDSRRLREGRGENCEVNNIIDPKNNLPCGVEIMHQQLLGEKSSYFPNSTGEVFWKSSYWLHLRLKQKNADETRNRLMKTVSTDANDKPNIKTLIMRFPYCR